MIVTSKSEKEQLKTEDDQKIPYPKSVFFIVIMEFCERFSYYGMKAILTLFLVNVLAYSDDSATVIYHVFSMGAYFTPLLGAMLADSLLGKFNTIFYLSIVYCAGNILLSLAATPPIGLPPIPFTMIGLALIALGTGGIKPCVSAFGGDQFILPQQSKQLVSFFSFFYMAINAGSLISTAITPIMRKDVQCFDQDTCYSLAFAVPAALMLVSLVVFVLGKCLYRETKPTGNVVLKLVKCIGHAISMKSKNKEKREHWLDHADDVYELRFIEDVKIVLRVLVLYLPIPVFWALFDQQGSRWTLQASRMDGYVAEGFTIKPDQVQVLNPALILLFIPLFDHVVYPLFAKCNLLKNPLQRLTIGGVLAGLAFIISGVLELELEDTYPIKLEPTQSNLKFVNTLPCNVKVSLGSQTLEFNATTLSQVFQRVEAKTYTVGGEASSSDIKIVPASGCEGVTVQETKIIAKLRDVEVAAQLEGDRSGGSFTYVIGLNENTVELSYALLTDDREKPKEGAPKLKFILQGKVFDDHVAAGGQLSTYITSGDAENSVDTRFDIVPQNNNLTGSDKIEHGYASLTNINLEPSEYNLTLVLGGYRDQMSRRIELNQFQLQLGGSYAVTITPNHTFACTDISSSKCYVSNLHVITNPSSLHMFWLLPQYVVITAGEIMLSITGLEFSYSQAPVSMKSVMQSAWLLTVAVGNLIVVIIAEAKFFEEQSKEFFLFAGLMFVDMILFAILAYRYVPAELEDPAIARGEVKDDN